MTIGSDVSRIDPALVTRGCRSRRCGDPDYQSHKRGRRRQTGNGPTDSSLGHQ